MNLVETSSTTVWKGRLTKQGLRDLNDYGPRPKKVVAGARLAATAANDTGAEAQPATAADTSGTEGKDPSASK